MGQVFLYLISIWIIAFVVVSIILEGVLIAYFASEIILKWKDNKNER